MTLSEYITRVPPERWLYIGTRSNRDGGGSGWLTIRRRKDMESWKRWEQFKGREVIETYKHNLVQPLGIGVLIEGTERGQFWAYKSFINSRQRRADDE